MVTLRKYSPSEWYVSYGYSSFKDYDAACDALHRAGVAYMAEHTFMPEHTFPAGNLQSAVAVLRLAGFTVEVEEGIKA